MMNSADDQQLDGVDVIHLWCGPRSLSTATMYSFAQRSDTLLVVDEPLYASYLKRNPSVYRPYRDDLLDSTEVDPDVVIKTAHLHAVDGKKKIVFMKHLGTVLKHLL